MSHWNWKQLLDIFQPAIDKMTYHKKLDYFQYLQISKTKYYQSYLFELTIFDLDSYLKYSNLEGPVSNRGSSF